MNLNQFIDAAGPLRALGVVISQNGEKITSHLWEGICRRNIYSASKSFTSAAVGIAIKEGLLTLDEKLTDAFTRDLPEKVDENLSKACVRDLLTMSLGQEKGFLMGVDRPQMQEADWVRFALRQPFVNTPGEKFVYNNVGPYLAGVLVQRRAGCDLVHYLMPRLFEPLGIPLPSWETDHQGNTFGAGGLMLTIDELHKFGLLYLQNGVWNGRRILTEEWVKASTSVQVDNGQFGYGYLFWGGPHGSFRADGKYGQMTILMRDKNAVVTVIAESREANKLLEAVFDHIYPQL